MRCGEKTSRTNVLHSLFLLLLLITLLPCILLVTTPLLPRPAGVVGLCSVFCKEAPHAPIHQIWVGAVWRRKGKGGDGKRRGGRSGKVWSSCCCRYLFFLLLPLLFLLSFSSHSSLILSSFFTRSFLFSLFSLVFTSFRPLVLVMYAIPLIMLDPSRHVMLDHKLISAAVRRERDRRRRKEEKEGEKERER